MASINDKLARKKCIGDFRVLLTVIVTVSHSSQNVEDQEYGRKDFLLLWILCEAQEDKVCYTVPWSHLVCTGAEFTCLKQFTYKTRWKKVKYIASYIFFIHAILTMCMEYLFVSNVSWTF